MPTFDFAACTALVEAMTALGVSAAHEIRRHRPDEGGIRLKSDGSPVTTADEAAEALILDGLARLDLDVPVISEEQAGRKRPDSLSANVILVDPLDGTREFIAGRGEYSVNIGLVHNGAPLLGVVAAPALGLVWRGIVGRGAERLEFSDPEMPNTSPPRRIHTRRRPDDELLVMTSRSHLDARTQAYLDALPHARRIACGSAVKFCRLAEGDADLYPRLGPTRDWDVAAGHAILAAAGGNVVAPGGTPLRYGSPQFRIPAFIAFGDAQSANAFTD